MAQAVKYLTSTFVVCPNSSDGGKGKACDPDKFPGILKQALFDITRITQQNNNNKFTLGFYNFLDQK
jgi:hypothetical protein